MLVQILKAALKQFWLELLAGMALVYVIWRYVALGEWEEHLPELALALFGFVSVAACDEVADWTGWYGWRRAQYRTYPEWFIRAAGAALLGYAAWTL